MTSPAAAGRRVAAKPWVRKAARFGLAAKGVLYAVIGAIALQIAIGGGGGGGEASQQGALQRIGQEPFGAVLLGVLAVGLAGYAGWRLIQAVRGTDEDSAAKDIALRIAAAFRAALYGLLSVVALQGIRGGGGGGGGDSEQELTARVLELPGGVVLVGIVGAVILVVGGLQAKRGVSAEFMEDLESYGVSNNERSVVRRLGVVGHVARAVVYGIIGGLLVKAALDADPDEAVGLDGALAELANRPYGPWLLGIVALGLVAYGAYCLVAARSVRTDAE